MKESTKSDQVFLSYARTDRHLAHALSRELKQHGLKVWDDQNISPGADWSAEITIALEECDSMIALLNEHSFSSSYVRKELQHAFFDERYKNRLLPVLIGGASDSEFSRLPWVLTKLTCLRITKEISPETMARRISKKFLAQINAERGKVK